LCEDGKSTKVDGGERIVNYQSSLEDWDVSFQLLLLLLVRVARARHVLPLE